MEHRQARLERHKKRRGPRVAAKKRSNKLNLDEAYNQMPERNQAERRASDRLGKRLRRRALRAGRRANK